MKKLWVQQTITWLALSGALKEKGFSLLAETLTKYRILVQTYSFDLQPLQCGGTPFLSTVKDTALILARTAKSSRGIYLATQPYRYAFIGRSNLLDPNGKRVEIGLAPYKRRVLKWTIWHFSIAGFDFYIKTDQQPFPRQWREFLANDNDPITIPVIDPLHLHQIPMLKPLFSQMMKKSG